MKDYVKHKESSYLKYQDVNNLYGQVMSQKLPVNKFEWIEDTSHYKGDYNEESDEGYFLEVDVLKNCIIFIMIYHFYHKE